MTTYDEIPVEKGFAEICRKCSARLTTYDDSDYEFVCKWCGLQYDQRDLLTRHESVLQGLERQTRVEERERYD